MSENSKMEIPKITDSEFIEQFGCDRKLYDKMLCAVEDAILKERDRILRSIEYDNDKTIIVVAYFHYDTGRSDICDFEDENSAKEWLLERWGFLLNGEEFNTLEELSYILRNEYYVKIEILIKKL